MFLVRAGESALARRVRQSRPASVFSFFCTARDRIDTGTSDQIPCRTVYSRARLRIWSRETVSAVPARVSFFCTVRDRMDTGNLIHRTRSHGYGTNATLLFERIYLIQPYYAQRRLPKTKQLRCEVKRVSKSVPVVTMPRLPRSCARGILGGSCPYYRRHLRPKDRFAFKEPCGPYFFLSLNRTGSVLRAISTNEHRPPRDHQEKQLHPTFLPPNGREPGRRGDHFRVRSRVELNVEALAYQPRTRRSASARLGTFFFFLRFFCLVFVFFSTKLK